MNRLISLLLVIIITTILSSSSSSFISTAFADVTITSCPTGFQSLAQNTNHGKVVFDNIDRCNIDIRNSQVSSIEFSTACVNNQINIENVQCVDSTVATCVHFSSDVQDSRDMTFKDITHTSVINFATPTEAKTQATIFFEKSLSMSRTSDFFQVEFSGISLRNSHCQNAICTSAAVHIKGEFTNVAYFIATNISIINTRGPSISTSVISALVFTTTRGISDDGFKKSELVIRGITVDEIEYDTPTAAGSLLITCFTTQGPVSQFTKVSFERMSIENSQLPSDNLLFVQIIVVNMGSTLAGAGDYIAAPSTTRSPSTLSVDECHIRNVVIGPLNPYAYSFMGASTISGFTHITLANSGLHDIQTTGSPFQCQWFVHRFENAISFPMSTSFATSFVVENNTLENFEFTTRRYTISGILRASPPATISGVAHLKLSNAVVRNLSFTNNQHFDNYAFVFYGAITGTGTADSLLSATNMVKEDNQLTSLGGNNVNSVLFFNQPLSNFTSVVFNNITSRREIFRAGVEVGASLVSMAQDFSGVSLSSSSSANNFRTAVVFSNLVMDDSTVEQGGAGAAPARVVLLSKTLTNFDHILFSNISFNRNTGISTASTPGTTRSLSLGAVVIDGSVTAREQQQQQQTSSSLSSFIVENVAITYPKMVLQPREVSVQIYVYRQQNSNILNNFQTVVLRNNSIRHFHSDALPSRVESVAIHQFGSMSADTSGQSSSNSSSFTMEFCNIENVSVSSNYLLAVSSLDVSSFISNFHTVKLTNNEISDVTLVSQLDVCELAIYKLNSIRITSSSPPSSNTLPSSIVVANSSISSIALTAIRDVKVSQFSLSNPASALQGYASVEFLDLSITNAELIAGNNGVCEVSIVYLSSNFGPKIDAKEQQHPSSPSKFTVANTLIENVSSYSPQGQVPLLIVRHATGAIIGYENVLFLNGTLRNIKLEGALGQDMPCFAYMIPSVSFDVSSSSSSILSSSSSFIMNNTIVENITLHSGSSSHSGGLYLGGDLLGFETVLLSNTRVTDITQKSSGSAVLAHLILGAVNYSSQIATGTSSSSRSIFTFQNCEILNIQSLARAHAATVIALRVEGSTIGYTSFLSTNNSILNTDVESLGNVVEVFVHWIRGAYTEPYLPSSSSSSSSSSFTIHAIQMQNISAASAAASAAAGAEVSGLKMDKVLPSEVNHTRFVNIDLQNITVVAKGGNIVCSAVILYGGINRQDTLAPHQNNINSNNNISDQLVIANISLRNLNITSTNNFVTCGCFLSLAEIRGIQSFSISNLTASSLHLQGSLTSTADGGVTFTLFRASAISSSVANIIRKISFTDNTIRNVTLLSAGSVQVVLVSVLSTFGKVSSVVLSNSTIRDIQLRSSLLAAISIYNLEGDVTGPENNYNDDLSNTTTSTSFMSSSNNIITNVSLEAGRQTIVYNFNWLGSISGFRNIRFENGTIQNVRSNVTNIGDNNVRSVVVAIRGNSLTNCSSLQIADSMIDQVHSSGVDARLGVVQIVSIDVKKSELHFENLYLTNFVSSSSSPVSRRVVSTVALAIGSVLSSSSSVLSPSSVSVRNISVSHINIPSSSSSSTTIQIGVASFPSGISNINQVVVSDLTAFELENIQLPQNNNNNDFSLTLSLLSLGGIVDMTTNNNNNNNNLVFTSSTINVTNSVICHRSSSAARFCSALNLLASAELVGNFFISNVTLQHPDTSLIHLPSLQSVSDKTMITVEGNNLHPGADVLTNSSVVSDRVLRSSHWLFKCNYWHNIVQNRFREKFLSPNIRFDCITATKTRTIRSLSKTSSRSTSPNETSPSLSETVQTRSRSSSYENSSSLSDSESRNTPSLEPTLSDSIQPPPPPFVSPYKATVDGLMTASIATSQILAPSSASTFRVARSMTTIHALKDILQGTCDRTILSDKEQEDIVVETSPDRMGSPFGFHLPKSAGGFASGTVISNLLWMTLSFVLPPLLLASFYSLRDFWHSLSVSRKSKMRKKNFRDNQLYNMIVESQSLRLLFHGTCALLFPTLQAAFDLVHIVSVSLVVKVIMCILGVCPLILLGGWIYRSLFVRQGLDEDAYFGQDEIIPRRYQQEHGVSINKNENEERLELEVQELSELLNDEPSGEDDEEHEDEEEENTEDPPGQVSFTNNNNGEDWLHRIPIVKLICFLCDAQGTWYHLKRLSKKKMMSKQKSRIDLIYSFYFALPLIEAHSSKFQRFAIIDIAYLVVVFIVNQLALWAVGSCIFLSVAMIVVNALYLIVLLRYSIPYCEPVNRYGIPIITLVEMTVLGVSINRGTNEMTISVMQLVLAALQAIMVFVQLLGILLLVYDKIRQYSRKQKLKNRVEKLKTEAERKEAEDAKRQKRREKEERRKNKQKEEEKKDEEEMLDFWKKMREKEERRRSKINIEKNSKKKENSTSSDELLLMNLNLNPHQSKVEPKEKVDEVAVVKQEAADAFFAPAFPSSPDRKRKHRKQRRESQRDTTTSAIVEPIVDL